jgi:hypothetical protein
MGSRAPVPARPAERTGTRNRCRRPSLGRWLPVPASPGRLRLRWLVRRVSLSAGSLACFEASTSCLRNDGAERGEGQGRRQCISRPTMRTGLPYQHPHGLKTLPQRSHRNNVFAPWTCPAWSALQALGSEAVATPKNEPNLVLSVRSSEIGVASHRREGATITEISVGEACSLDWRDINLSTGTL